ncbi:neuromedin-K receptor-like [Orbicella faveolata]|uniref:neuromedin-K receptor-like n=1 Tax=Orbicella faveolata TaxID=48498 RepID=UPI0009E29D49|nr:neuromedin-K receptor-like [Orbicella faveolata]XP_020629064.1 neuromedin-K receptor-like [Orbicella faveolata]
MSENYTETKVNGSGGSSLCVIQPATPSTQVGLTIVYFIVFFVALVGNALVIFVVHRHPKLKTTFNMLIVNMAASDILDVITAIPLSIAYLYESVKWFSGGFGAFLCKTLPFLAFVSIGTSVLTLTVMTFDRYRAIVHTMRRPLTPKLTAVAIGSTWVISGLVFASELYKYKLFNAAGQVMCASRWVEDVQESNKITMYELIVRFVLLYLIPLLTMAVLYTRIVLHLWKRKAPGEHIDKTHQRIEKQKRKVVTMLVTIVTIFAICWLPAHVNHFLVTFNFNVYSCLPTSLVLSLYFLTHANTAINPCLYLVFNESFREGFRHQIYHRLSGRLFNGSDRFSTSRAEAISASATASHISLVGSKQGSKREDRYDTPL